ncbi:proline iminopeptidase [Georgenia soli]|uniref:Proline iminopeptidase n=1 Tax=Georgenia soli TaxID=638953 RepID=A0A2A9EQB7_9MICO|nr:proline iminopeptidase [Georgenia soli]
MTASQLSASPRSRASRTFGRVRDGAVVLGEYAVETVYAVTHPEWRRSGATPDEQSRELPGDDLVPAPNWSATRAETIRATPQQVWPWLAQMGYGRGGWYSDFPWWKDPAGHRGRRSAAERVLPDHQQLEVGQVLLDGPNCSEQIGSWWVRDVEPARHLVLYSSRTIDGREVRFLPRRPRSYFDCSWAFVLVPDGDSVRLLVRTRVCYRPGWVVRLMVVLRAGDTVMQRAMLLGIRRRVETAGSLGAPRRRARASLRHPPVRSPSAPAGRATTTGAWWRRRHARRRAGAG